MFISRTEKKKFHIQEISYPMQLSLKILTFTSHTLYACRQHKIFASFFLDARVAELVDAPDLGSGAFGREGSTPFARTIFKINFSIVQSFDN